MVCVRGGEAVFWSFAEGLVGDFWSLVVGVCFLMLRFGLRSPLCSLLYIPAAERVSNPDAVCDVVVSMYGGSDIDSSLDTG